MKKLLMFLCLVSAASAQVNYGRMLSGVNYQTNPTYALTPVDVNRLVSFNNATGIAVTLPYGLRLER